MRLLLLFALLTTSAGCGVVEAQTRFGVSLGRSLVGSGGSRVPVFQNGEAVLTGASQAGWFGSAQIESPISSSAFSFRGEVSYSRLRSNPQTFSGAGAGQFALPTASADQSIGLSASLVAATSRTARLAPYAVAGLGWYSASLTPPGGDANSTRFYGNGLGMQLGAGLRYRVGRMALMFETRLVQPMSNVRGVNYMPLTLGVQF